MRRFNLWSFLVLVLLLGTVTLFGQSGDQAQTPSDDAVREAGKLFNEGNSLYRTGNYLGAIEKYKAAIAGHKDYRYYYQLGLSYKNTRQSRDAIGSFEEALKLKNDFAIGHNALGGTFLENRNFDKAIESFKLALRHDPQMDRAKKGLSESYAGKIQDLVNDGKISEANTLVEEATEQHSDNAKLYLLAAIVYNKMEKPEKAIESSQEALKLKKRGAKGAEYFEIGMAYKKLKEFDKARTAFTEARKDPQYSRNAQYELDGLKGK